MLEQGGGPPLGVRNLVHYTSQRVALAPGSVLVLYTDGLIERRRESLDLSLRRLRERVAAGVGEDPEQLADQLICAEREDRDFDDDLAVLIAVLNTPADVLELELAATVASAGTVRGAMRRWLQANDIRGEDEHDLLLACHEAVTNVIEHAYAPSRGRLRVRASLDAGRVKVTVTDQGTWRLERQDGQGRGLRIITALMDGAEVIREDGGTTLQLSKLLLST